MSAEQRHLFYTGLICSVTSEWNVLPSKVQWMKTFKVLKYLIMKKNAQIAQFSY